MAHWAEVDKNNVVLRITIGSNDELDEGYQWLIDNLGGTWIKTSYNTIQGKHLLGGIPFRGNYAGIGYTYYSDIDAFMPPSPYPSWVLNKENYDWVAPVPVPDNGFWRWNEETLSWIEYEPEIDEYPEEEK